jgi:hypothetical protein
MGKALRAFFVALMALLAASGPAVQAQAPYDARAAAECLLGAEDAEAQSLLLFRRQFSVEGVVTGSLADSAWLAGAPAAPMPEAERALSSAIDLDHELTTGDRFYLRWEQVFTLDNEPVGIGRVLTVELRTAKKGLVAISRFRPLKAPMEDGEHFYFADGRQAAPPPVGPPLDRIEITSGFGLRPDPLDQPEHLPPVVAPPTASSPPPPPPQRSLADIKEIAHAYAGFSPDRGQLGSARDASAGFDIKRRDAEIDRIMAERRARGREEAQRLKAEKEALEKEAAAPPPPPPPPTHPAKPVLLYMHEGLDLLANLGTPVHAAADGFVTLARPDRGYGNAIRIEHAGRLTTLYGHLLRIAPDIETGRYVRRGDVIGFVGSTGRSTGAHLHFEVLVNGKPHDPTTLTQPVQLAGFDLARFKKQLALEQEFRAREAALAAAPNLAAFGPASSVTPEWTTY